MSIYRQFGVEPIINATGTVTRLGGAPMPPAVLDAFHAAAQDAVSLEELQAAAGRKLAAVTQTEAGLVTAGSAAALTLGAAAILARHSYPRIEQLPHCDGNPCEFLVARDQRSGYDHAVRAAGAKLVDVGFNEVVSGAGVRRPEVWEYEAAITDQTAGVLYVQSNNSQPALQEVVRCAHAAGLPVLVDAAGELPPRSNLVDIPASGADLVAFSGGKAIRGPQSTGILCGKREFISSAALQMLDLDDHYQLWEPPADLIDTSQLSGLPRHGIGRGLKVSKEEIVALLVAVDLFVSGAYDDDLARMQDQLDEIKRLVAPADIDCQVVLAADGQRPPLLRIQLDPTQHAAFDICRQLRAGTPAIYVGHGRLVEHQLVINPLGLRDDDATLIGERLCQLLGAT
ncbi:MAG: selenocysteine synthase [Blastopirellula sp.]|nr:selenocysteine synthase [Blastopirellula sp.]